MIFLMEQLEFSHARTSAKYVVDASFSHVHIAIEGVPGGLVIVLNTACLISVRDVS